MPLSFFAIAVIGAIAPGTISGVIGFSTNIDFVHLVSAWIETHKPAISTSKATARLQREENDKVFICCKVFHGIVGDSGLILACNISFYL